MEFEITWVPLLQGALSVGHRPKRKALKILKQAGVTHLFTLLSEKEGAPSLGGTAQNAGLEWIWLPLAGAQPPEETRDAEIKAAFLQAKSALEAGAKIQVHCSAGIHRTGMISYALLRVLGESPAEAMNKLRALRQVTGEGVGDHRIAWGDAFAARTSL